MKRVVITREKEESEKFARKLKEAGFEPVIFPTIKTVPVDFSVQNIYEYDVYIFTSKNAVKYFFSKTDITKIKNKTVLAVGEKTKKSLEKLGFEDITVPEKFSSEGMLELIKKNIDFFKDKKILIPRAKKGINTLVDNLKNQVKEIKILPVYETVLNIPENVKEVENLYIKDAVDFTVFTSPSTVEGFFRSFGGKSYGYLEKTCIAVIGTTTKKAVEKKGLKVCIIPEKFTVEGIIHAIVSVANYQ